MRWPREPWAAGQAYAQIPAAIGGAVNQGLSGYYLGQQMRPPSTPQPGYAYNPNSVPYNPWEFPG